MLVEFPSLLVQVSIHVTTAPILVPRGRAPSYGVSYSLQRSRYFNPIYLKLISNLTPLPFGLNFRLELHYKFCKWYGTIFILFTLFIPCLFLLLLTQKKRYSSTFLNGGPLKSLGSPPPPPLPVPLLPLKVPLAP